MSKWYSLITVTTPLPTPPPKQTNKQQQKKTQQQQKAEHVMEGTITATQ